MERTQLERPSMASGGCQEHHPGQAWALRSRTRHRSARPPREGLPFHFDVPGRADGLVFLTAVEGGRIEVRAPDLQDARGQIVLMPSSGTSRIGLPTCAWPSMQGERLDPGRGPRRSGRVSVSYLNVTSIE
jgi:hypothetical protein